MSEPIAHENIELTWVEPKTSINIAKFIITHTYYFLRKIYEDDLLKWSKTFTQYIDLFKQYFKKSELLNKFSFDIINKSYDEDLDNNNKIEEKIYSKEDEFYKLKYKQFINIINEQNPYNINDKKITSLISIVNCFIYLEYMYIFLTKYPDKISHYIIKIDISFLLIIPEQTSKRLINSDEYFYLNLIELKERFGEIDFTPSEFIRQLQMHFSNKFLKKIKKMKKMKKSKLTILELELSKLYNQMIKFNHPQIGILLDHIEQIKKNLISDINNKNDTDILIDQYINKVEKRERKNLQEILNEIAEKKSIPKFNYLYLISLNCFNELNLENTIEKNINEHKNEINNEDLKSLQINNIKSFNDNPIKELNKNSDDYNKNIIDNDNDKYKNLTKEESINKNKNFNKVKEGVEEIQKKIIVQIEELILEKKEINDKLISLLTIEKLIPKIVKLI